MCAGLLTAYAVASSHTCLEFEKYDAAAICLAMMIRTATDAQDAWHGKAKSYMAASGLSGPQISTLRMPSLKPELRDSPMSMYTVGLSITAGRSLLIEDSLWSNLRSLCRSCSLSREGPGAMEILILDDEFRRRTTSVANRVQALPFTGYRTREIASRMELFH